MLGALKQVKIKMHHEAETSGARVNLRNRLTNEHYIAYFNGKAIEQTGSTTHINSATVPKGYVNLSQMCKAGGKRLVDYLQKDKRR